MKVVIVGKTRMPKLVCIGAISKDASLRLLRPGEYHFEENVFELGQVVRIDGNRKADPEPPHTEDYIVAEFEIIDRFDATEVRDLIVRKDLVVEGAYTVLLDGALHRKHTGKLIVTRENVPGHSTEFWLTPCNFSLQFEGDDEDRPVYVGEGSNTVRMPYVGLEPPIAVIPKGSIVRISLARWWRGRDGNEPEACYAQVSGWWLN